jgi:polyisoprenoid-binding protein YceI
MSLHRTTSQTFSGTARLAPVSSARGSRSRLSPGTTILGKKGHRIAACVLTLFSALTTGLAHGEWQLKNAASQLNFISTKASHIAEIHTFDRLSGSVDDTGKAAVNIDLTSVNTGIGIRDERMQSMLFNVVDFPQAQITTVIDLQRVSKTTPTVLPVEATLSLAGATATVAGEVLVSPSGADSVTVTTIAPIVIGASQLDLQPGIEALREIAGLPSIGYSVPVTFSLTFQR